MAIDRADKITSLDVARRAGVSQSAVSRVFTPGGSASQRTVEKVRKAAEELGYRPNILARAMITGKSRIIGLVVAYLDNYFYPLAVERLSVALQKQGYHVLVFMASNTVDDVETVMQEILDYQVDGIVLASVSMSSLLAGRCDDQGISVVLFNRTQPDARLASVSSDNVAGGQQIARHLVAGGAKKIGYIAGFAGASTQIDREAGFRKGLADRGATMHMRGIGNFQHDQARAAALEMFAGRDRPDAVFVCNDHMAFAVMDVLRGKLGLDVPGDVAVVGFDDVPIAAWAAYDLTTFRQPLDDMVARTVDTLMERIADDAVMPRRHVLPGQLILRQSTHKADLTC
jgi:DNA-binding LacI/PurR family transcriptional regulator